MILGLFYLFLLAAVGYYTFNYIRRKILRDLALDVIKTFNKFEVTYWADFGTLLGIIREGDIILGDGDVDICIVNKKENIEKVEAALKDLNHQGYTTEKMDWNAYRVYSHYFFHADIYINNLDDVNRVYLGATGGENSNISYDLIGIRQKIKWLDTDVFVPEKIKETLIWRYGEDYMIPQDSKGRDS